MSVILMLLTAVDRLRDRAGPAYATSGSSRCCASRARSCEFGDRRALDAVDLDMGPAETVAVLGPSGSGKTTLLRAVAGLQRARRGPHDAGTAPTSPVSLRTSGASA